MSGGNPVYGEPPDFATHRAFWRLLHAAVRRAESRYHLDSDAARQLGAELDEACVVYASTLSKSAKEMIAIKAREGA